MRPFLTLCLLLSFNFILPGQYRELLYVHTDRTLYEPGDFVWFRAYLTDPQLRLDQVASDVLTIQLLDPGGTVIQTVNLYRGENGHDGHLQLQAELKGGRYTLRAYTNWLGNYGPEHLYTKHLYLQELANPNLLLYLEPERESFTPGSTVAYTLTARGRDGEPLAEKIVSASLRIAAEPLQEFTFLTDAKGIADLRLPLPEGLSTSDVIISATVRHAGEVESALRTVRVSLGYVNLRFFPEGGGRSRGAHKIAFRATDRNGKPLDLSGRVMAGGLTQFSFQSTHNGYGHFILPAAGRLPLYVELDGYTDTTFRLPQVFPMSISATADVRPEEVELSVGSNQGTPFYDLQLLREDTLAYQTQVYPGTTTIPLTGLPPGVYLMRLADETTRIRWERLFFHRPPEIILSGLEAKQITNAHEHHFRLEDTTGQTISGDFSVAIVDDGPYTRQNDKQPHLVAQLLLQSQLTGKLYEPNDYFDSQQPKAMAALDDVMLCHGWRMYESPQVAGFKHQPLKTGLNGYIRQGGNRNKSVAHRALLLNGKKIRPNANGHFFFPIRAAKTLAIYPEARGYYYDADISRWQKKQVLQVLPGPLLFTPTSEQTLRRRAQTLKKVSFEKQQLKNVSQELSGALSGIEITRNESEVLDEVVVVGYSSVRKANMSAAVVSHSGNLNSGYSIRNYEEEIQLRSFEYVSLPSPFSLQPKLAYSENINFSRAYNPDDQPPALLYWNPGLKPGKDGRFHLPHQAPSLSANYRIILEGITEEGTPIHLEETFYVAAPLEFNVQFPEHAVEGDVLLLTATVQNNGPDTLRLWEQLQLGPLFEGNTGKRPFKVPGNEVVQLRQKVTVKGQEGKAKLRWRVGQLNGRKDLIRKQDILLHPRLFTHLSGATSAGGKELEVIFKPKDAVGEVTGELQLYGGPVDEIIQEFAGMLREPHGCFEQVTSTSYPNALIVGLLQDTDDQRYQDKLRQARSYLASGYRQLSKYEQTGGGFGLWQNTPAKPRYSAMALLQFADLARVWDGVDPKMINRTRQYLKQRVEQRGFEASPAQLYQVLALATYGDPSLAGLIEQHGAAVATKPDEHYYRLLLAQTLLVSGDTLGARSQVQSLVGAVLGKSLNANAKSAGIGSAYGRFSQVEMLGYFIEIYLITEGYDGTAEEAFSWMTELKNSKYYQPTQAKIRYLRALRALAKHRPQPEDGFLEVFVNGARADTINYVAGKSKVVKLQLRPHLQAGDNRVRFRFGQRKDYPALRWQAKWQMETPPQTDEPLPLTFRWRVDSTARVGDIVSYRLELQNTDSTEVKAPMLQIGLPGNTELLLKDLDPLIEQGIIAYYERDGHYLNLYLDEMGAGQTRAIPLDLTARIAGDFLAPPTVCYPYYQPHLRMYRKGVNLKITER